METNTNNNTKFIHLKDLLVIAVTISVCSFLVFIPPCISTASQFSKSASQAQTIPQVHSPVGVVDTGQVHSQHRLFDESADVDRNPHNGNTVLARMETETTPKVHDSVPFNEIINRAAGRYQVDPFLIRAIIFAESGYNPNATSKKGAQGLMQLMPSTAESLGVLDSYDPEENIDGGVRYFKTLLDRFEGDVQLALAAYNAGSRHVRNYEGVPPFKATRRYIQKVLKFQKKFKMEVNSGTKKIV